MFSVDEIVNIIIMVQTTMFAITASISVDFVIQNFRRSNNILWKIAKMRRQGINARLAAMIILLIYKLLVSVFANAQFVKCTHLMLKRDFTIYLLIILCNPIRGFFLYHSRV